ncbi:unnamed protein product [Rhizoctonia solani]|uniref:ThuA-like domain-containing protein n=1 Tax=Rhizoctonia solani TaxID=456999 RepID=A0A8H3D8N7_9AGAM|nr:unnamed protein product [Rhizoctonia solani]
MIVPLILSLAGFVAAQEFPSTYTNPLLAKVLIYSYCDGFRHDSIPTAVKQLQAWGPYWNVSFDATEDQTKIRTENLAQYDAMVFVSSTGNIFDSQGQTAFVDYLAKGGNFAAIHAASAAYLEKAWNPWTQSLGATFDHHPAFQTATFVKEATGYPATDPAPDRWTFGEEVYSFTSDPRKLGATLLFSVDPKSYNDSGTPAGQGNPHPIAWQQEYAAGAVAKAGGPGPGVPGRSFYSSLGHANSTWMDATFMKHVMGGITWTFSSNTTRVASGLYSGTSPTVRTGATNNVTSAATAQGTPVLGSDQTAPSPPAKPTTTSTTPPESTGGSTSSSSASTSGAIMSVPAGAWAVAAAALGAILGTSF